MLQMFMKGKFLKQNFQEVIEKIQQKIEKYLCYGLLLLEILTFEDF